MRLLAQEGLPIDNEIMSIAAILPTCDRATQHQVVQSLLSLCVNQRYVTVGLTVRRKALPALVRLLESDDPTLIREVSTTISIIGLSAKDVPVLMELLKHPKEEVRWRGAAYLGQIGPAAAPGDACAGGTGPQRSCVGQ